MKRLFLLILLLFMGCSWLPFSKTPRIRIKGSDTMQILANHWAEAYMTKNPNISVYVDGGGTATGARALANGDVEIATASRPMRPEEVRRLADNFGTVGVSILVAKDALSVYLHPNNPVKNLTTEQLKKIYTKEITNWKQVGGKDRDIVLLNRMPNSGTFVYFQEHILDGEPYSSNSTVLPTTQAMINAVMENPDAIGFGGIGYETSKVHVAINGVLPTKENVINDKYPITRYLYFYTTNTPRGSVKRFIDWVLSAEGQAIVQEEGYFPIWNIP